MSETDAEFTALMILFRDHANRALDPDDDMDRKHALANIRDVCDAVLDDE